MAATSRKQAALLRPFAFGLSKRFVRLFQSVVRVFLKGKEKLWQWLTDRRVNKHNNDRADDDACKVEKCPQPLPASSFWIIKNWLRHATETKHILAGGCRRVKPTC